MIPERSHRLSDLARAGFQELTEAQTRLEALLEHTSGVSLAEILDDLSCAADPDAALIRCSAFAERHPGRLSALSPEQRRRLAILVGASPALGDFFCRVPDRLEEILAAEGRVIDGAEASRELSAAIDGMVGEPGWNALRSRYRQLLAEVALFDLLSGWSGDATDVFDDVARSLAALADGAMEAALSLARASLVAGESGPPVPQDRMDAVRLAVVAMGKCGAQELNVVSDVDVMFIVDTADSEVIDDEALMRLGTRLAREMMRAIHDPAFEPPLWQIDANLRPEGRHGPLVRTLSSMIAYYDRWAKAWEFQALLKARPAAGDRGLGGEFVARTRPLVWASATREDFVGSVQRMRQRVTEHIDDDDLEVQLKLGPGGLRDIEFSVQLLQLVHGQYDERLHVRGTIPALEALVTEGYVARSDATRLAADYRFLRVLEHRLQLRELRRTALMPRDEEGLRVLARASRLARTGTALRERWQIVKRDVRELHLKIFYAPLLSAVAALPEEELVLGSAEARARLTSIGFRDPDGAIRHLAALTRGTSRRAKIQRNLMPVLLQWLSDGTDPDFGLLAFRRVSEANQDTPWYLRLLRDGTVAGERLMRVLSCSRFVADLLESMPESVAWLERAESLEPPALQALLDEMRALASRRDSIDDAASALRIVHRREILRLAMGRVIGVTDDDEVARGLDAAHTALLDGLLLALRRTRPEDDAIELTLIGMGRFGGGEMGFGSDIDLMAVCRAPESGAPDDTLKRASGLVAELRRLISDPRFPVDLDFDLRPEGKNGPLVRSLESYRAYYARWSVTWETQALLRARPVAGSAQLGRDFVALADELRYPAEFPEQSIREVRRIKARVESERLPRGVEPNRHLKLGPGGISDVEWLVQLIQLEHGSRHPDLRTVSTLGGLAAAVSLEYLSDESGEHLEESWRFASEIRSAGRLWSGKSSNVLPFAREDLEGIAGVLGLPSGQTTELEERWLSVARRARAVFEREFFGYSESDERFPSHSTPVQTGWGDQRPDRFPGR